MIDCPIGLICDYFKCDRGYCQNLANPWPLPYYINPGWLPGVYLWVEILPFDYDTPNVEYLIIQAEEDNRWVESVRQELWRGGWWKAEDLPYQPHPEGGLLVIHHLRLTEEVTFACPWVYDSNKRYNCSPTHREQFMPPVPLDGYRRAFTDDYIEDDGFYRDFLLRWASDFVEQYEYDEE
ncbi:MAG: hypothetical protein V7L11_27190 [Nostoc sp.]|uniref:hypothetical protein n=1 Tax=Nostoc sp. TaxID=1180 RepID=UPI002FF61F89